MEYNNTLDTMGLEDNLIPTNLRLPKMISNEEHEAVYERGLMLANVGRTITPEDETSCFFKLENRLNRYERLDKLGAPIEIIDKEAELVFKASIEVERKLKEILGNDWSLYDMRNPEVEICDEGFDAVYQESVKIINIARAYKNEGIEGVHELEDKLNYFEYLIMADAPEEAQYEALVSLTEACFKVEFPEI